jgi:hypothetical protein
MSTSGFNYNKNNSWGGKKSKPASLPPPVLSSGSQYSSKNEAEKMKDLNTLYRLFPKDEVVKKAIEKSRKKSFPLNG